MERVERRGAKGWGPVLQGTEGWAGSLPAATGPRADLPKMGSNFKVFNWVLNRKPHCWSSLSVRACSKAAVPSPHSQRAGGCSMHRLSHNKCSWVRRSSGLQSLPPLTTTSCFPIQTFHTRRRSQEWSLCSFLDYPSRQCCQGSPGSPLCGCCELFGSVHILSTLHVCVPGGRACLMWKCPPDGHKGTNWQASEASGIWKVSSHNRHLTASPKFLLYKGEKSEVAERTWAQVGTFAQSNPPALCCLGILQPPFTCAFSSCC